MEISNFCSIPFACSVIILNEVGWREKNLDFEEYFKIVKCLLQAVAKETLSN